MLIGLFCLINKNSQSKKGHMKLKEIVCRPEIFANHTGSVELVNMRTLWTLENMTEVEGNNSFESQNGLSFFAVAKVLEGVKNLNLLTGTTSANSFEFALFVKVGCEWRIVSDSNIVFSSAGMLEEFSAKVISFIKSNNITLHECPVSVTTKKLDAQIKPPRPNMSLDVEVLYTNKKTGTVVYRIKTSNNSFPRNVFSSVAWTCFLVGNEHGFAKSARYVHLEADLCVGQIFEDQDMVVIPRFGTQTTHFGIRVSVDNLIFKKVDFRPYKPNKLV